MLLDSNMRLNIDIKVIVKKWLVLINVHGSIFVQQTECENNPALPTRRGWKKYTRKLAREIPTEE